MNTKIGLGIAAIVAAIPIGVGFHHPTGVGLVIGGVVMLMMAAWEYTRSDIAPPEDRRH